METKAGNLRFRSSFEIHNRCTESETNAWEL